MRIYTQLIFDMETMRLVAEESRDYFGPVEWCKGDSTAKAAEQQQASFDASLMNIFQSQYATQKSQLDYLTAKMKPMIDNPTGLSPEALASARTSATDTNSQQYRNAQAALNNEVSQASGGSKLTGVAGANVQADAALAAAEANQEATSQEGITAQNEALKNSNYWNAINALNGTAAMQNPLGYASAATGGSDAVSNLGNTVNAANQSQLLGALGGVVGGIGGALVGKLPPIGCWIFASFFGWNDIRTWIMRHWLHTQAPAVFRRFYLAYGKRIAKTPMRWAFRPLATYVLANLETN